MEGRRGGGGRQTCGHEHEGRVGAGDRLEADCVADRLADALATLGCNARCDGDGGDPAGLAAEDAAGPAGRRRSLEDVLRHLRRLTAAGLSGDDDDLVLVQLRKHLQRLTRCCTF